MTKTRTNERGNKVESDFYFDAARYYWDLGEGFKGVSGWDQYDTDQDASYFGVWINKITLQTFTYCEGDTTLITCPDVAHFNDEIENMNQYYSEGRIVRIIDTSGKVTDLVQDRAKFLIPSN